VALVTGARLLVAARAGGYAVGAFNTSNLEITQAILAAAAEERSPVIVATSQSAIEYAGHAVVRTMVETLAQAAGVPVSLHLDHGTDPDVVARAIEHGWTSVMIDGSHHAFEENVRLTRAVVELAHPRGVSVEAELGRLRGVEDAVSVTERDASFTDPEEAGEFVARTGCDALAVAIGTSHGAYKFRGEPRLAIDRLAAIAGKVSIPLVLHGASAVPPDVLALFERYGGRLPGAKGVPPASIREAIALGIAKVNIDTDIRLAFAGHVRRVLSENPDVFDPRKILAAAREGMQEVVRGKMRLFGSSGRA
jgi:fructose-bisphosphate aldolase class II